MYRSPKRSLRPVPGTHVHQHVGSVYGPSTSRAWRRCHMDGSMTLFLVLSHMDYEGFRINHTCTSFEEAVGVVGRLLEPDDWVTDAWSVLAVSPGPGTGVRVAYWRAERRYGEHVPCDGEGPALREPSTHWERQS